MDIDSQFARVMSMCTLCSRVDPQANVQCIVHIVQYSRCPAEAEPSTQRPPMDPHTAGSKAEGGNGEGMQNLFCLKTNTLCSRIRAGSDSYFK